MRTQKELMRDAVDTLDLIIKKMLDASVKWGEELMFLETYPDKEDEKLVDLATRIKLGAEVIRTYTTDFSKDALSLEQVVNGTAFLFKGGN
jgi:hypothetical protein